jgi:hypothetical protein
MVPMPNYCTSLIAGAGFSGRGDERRRSVGAEIFADPKSPFILRWESPLGESCVSFSLLRKLPQASFELGWGFGSQSV